MRGGSGRLRLPGGAARIQIDGPRGAPVLILGLSLAVHLGLWDEQVAVWARHFQVVRYDLPGHGGSAPPDGSCSIEGLGRQALALMDALGIRRAHWCGLSLGGMVGLWLMANAPERVGHAVVAHASAYLGSREIWDGRILTAARRGMEPLVEPTLALWFAEQFRNEAPAAVERIRGMIRQTSVAGFQCGCAAIRDTDLRASLAAIPHRVLVIVGRHDRGTPLDQGFAVANGIPQADSLSLDTGHLGNVEQPEAFARAVERFLTQDNLPE